VNAPALVISALGVPWALAATFVLRPTFAGMFADFGGALPRVTMLALEPWGPLALAVGSFVVVVLAAASKAAPAWTPVVIALVTLALQIALFLVAMYLPIWSLAGQIR
jgi:type II secretory pathway component PulF